MQCCSWDLTPANGKLQECHGSIVISYDWQLSEGTSMFGAAEGGKLFALLELSPSLLLLAPGFDFIASSYLNHLTSSYTCNDVHDRKFSPLIASCIVGATISSRLEEPYPSNPILPTLHVIFLPSPILSELSFSTTTSIPSKPYLLAPIFTPQTRINPSTPINLLQISLNPTL